MIRGLFALMILGIIATLCLFVGFTWKVFAMKPKGTTTDAVVVLAGGKGRIEEGIRLYRSGGGTMLFFIGVDPAVRKRDLVKELPGERIILESVSHNTLENAVYARELLVRNGVRSMQLITSRYHLPRAQVIFRNVFPKDIAIYPYPVDTGNFKEEWWLYRGTFRLLWSEFYKYYLYRIFFLVSSGELRSGSSLVGGHHEPFPKAVVPASGG